MTLPGGHGVFTIMEAKWMKMDLNYLGSPNKYDAKMTPSARVHYSLANSRSVVVILR